MSDALDLYIATRLAFLDRPDVRLCTRPLFNRQAVTIYAIDDELPPIRTAPDRSLLRPAPRSWASATVAESEMARDPDRQLVELVAGEMRQTFDRLSAA